MWYDEDMAEFLNQSKQEQGNTGFESLTEGRKLAEKVAGNVWYSGVFIDPDELYSKFPPQLENPVECPHVTTNFKPDANNLHLDSLGSKARIFAVGYANDGKNEGLLVRVEAEDPVIQKTLDERKAPDRRFGGELRPVPTHITLSTSEKGDDFAAATKYLDFKPLDEPVEISGKFMLHMEDNSLISDISMIKGE